jgi:hypothetical protein
MFNYSLDQFVELYLWEREQEIRALHKVNRARAGSNDRPTASWVGSERFLAHVGRLLARLSHAPHGRA